MSTDTAVHVLTDEGVPIGWSVIADRPELAYLADPDAGRPATPAEMEATEAAAYREYAAAMAANAAIGTAPRGPWPVARAAVTAPEAAAEPEPQPEAAEPVSEAPNPGMAALVVKRQAEDEERKFAGYDAAFAEDPEGDGDRAQPDATTQIEAVGDATEVIEGSETA